MAKVTWLGEDDDQTGLPGPSFTTAFGGIKFPKGEAVEVRSKAFVQKALGSQFFEVEDADDVDDAKPRRGRPPNPKPAPVEAKPVEAEPVKADAN